MSKHALMDQTLQNMRGHSTIAQILYNSSDIDKGSFRIRKTLEAWHTSVTKHVDNNSKPIPNQQSILFEQQSHKLHVYTLLLFFLLFYLAFSCIYFIILHSIFIRRTLQIDTRNNHVTFLDFLLASERFYLLSQRLCLEATVFKYNRHFRIVFRKRQS